MKTYRYTSNTMKLYSSTQAGLSVTGIVFLLFALGVFIKLAIAIIPAQIGDYQLDKAIAHQLKNSNDNKETPTQFLASLSKQLSLNADRDTDPKEILTFTNKSLGELAVHKQYAVTNNFIGNVDILNRFEGDISAKDAD